MAVLIALTVGLTVREEKAWPFYALGALLGLFALAGLAGLITRSGDPWVGLGLLVVGGVGAGASIRGGIARSGQPRARVVVPKDRLTRDLPTGQGPVVDDTSEWAIEDLFPPLPPDLTDR